MARMTKEAGGSVSVEVRVPVLPESVPDATVAGWHKKPGDSVDRDENLVDLETEKVVLEVPAPQGGILREVLKAEGDRVGSDELIAVIEPADAKAPSRPKAPLSPVEQSVESRDAKAAKPPVTVPAAARPSEGPRHAAAGIEVTAPGERAVPPLSPAVRRLLAEHGLDPKGIVATGPGGRLTKQDVEGYLADLAKTEPAQPVSQPTVEPPVQMEMEPTRPERRVAMTRLRARIAERLVQAQRSAALLTTMNEINMQAVMDLRRRHRERFHAQHGVKLGIVSLFVKACVEALRRFPIVNASVDGSDIVYHDYYDIGIAVDSPRGLVVPVLRDADKLSLAAIEVHIADFAAKAKDGTLGIEDLSGGTFTISNGGVFGSLLSTPIVNPPQSAILGLHKIMDRPVAEDGELAVRPMMYVALSYDHRIIDGRDAVQFLVSVKDLIEDPVRLLLQA